MDICVAITSAIVGNDNVKLAEEQAMINQISTKPSARAAIALLALTGGCVPSVATDYRDNYGNNAYYGNFYGNNSGNGNSIPRLIETAKKVVAEL